MKRVYTHYDNLKISRTAPPEIIRAAYKALSQKHHPDRNPNDPDADRIMAAINAAYEVLSDPQRRQEHDNWIDRMENSEIPSRQGSYQPQRRPARLPNFGVRLLLALRDAAVAVVTRLFAIVIGFGALFGLLWLISQNSQLSTPTKSTLPSNSYSSTPIYQRPLAAPNGKSWPSSAGYVPGYAVLNREGMSSLTIDNTANESDVFVKVFYLGQSKAIRVRQVFIPGGAKFRIKSLKAGHYDIRYQELDSGALAKSEIFQLEERRTEDGVVFSDMRMTLYSVRGGNMDMQPISPDEF